MPPLLQDALLPSYLTDENKRALREELEGFPENLRYYLNRGADSPLQGDVLDQRPYVIFSGNAPEVRRARVMIISNSCDISYENSRVDSVSVLVAPVGKLESLIGRLSAAGLSKNALDSRLESIRKQETTTMFYLPAGAGIGHESVVYLDAIQSIPRKLLKPSEGRVAVLSQYGFYLLLVKLSYHLCRAKEGLDRSAAVN